MADQSGNTPSEAAPGSEEWLAIRDRHIEHLEAALRETEQRLYKLESVGKTLDTLRQEHIAYTNAYQQRSAALQEQLHRLQKQYEQLRLQKGGFGFKAIIAGGIAGFILAFPFFYLLMRPKDAHEQVFAQFQRENSFQLEHSLSQGNFRGADDLLRAKMSDAEYAIIQPELAFLIKINNAAYNAFENADKPTNANESYVIAPQNTDLLYLQTSAPSTLVITENNVSVRSEAGFKAPELTRVSKGAELGQWDRTVTLDKLRLQYKGQNGLAQDYWYEVETADSVKGWVFGFFTNRSIRRFKPDAPADSLQQKPPADTSAQRQ